MFQEGSYGVTQASKIKTALVWEHFSTQRAPPKRRNCAATTDPLDPQLWRRKNLGTSTRIKNQIPTDYLEGPENAESTFFLAFWACSRAPIANSRGLLLGRFSAINVLNRGQQRREQAHRICFPEIRRFPPFKCWFEIQEELKILIRFAWFSVFVSTFWTRIRAGQKSVSYKRCAFLRRVRLYQFRPW